MGKNSLKALAFAMLPAMMAVVVSCGKKDTGQTVVIWRVGEVELQRQGEAARQVELQDIVKQGDRIVTKANHSRCSDRRQGDRARAGGFRDCISNINDPAAIEMALDRGEVLSKVDKLAKGQSYGVRMPTALAAVRGTEFSATYMPGRNVVAVKAGKVEVTLSGRPRPKPSRRRLTPARRSSSAKR
jgi:ferric-dicitrate binding protein FerR (iron transport regulator)